MKYVASTILLALVVLTFSVVRADDEHMMTKEQLRPLLGKSDVIIIDVRTNYDWDSSKVKIPGAVREEGMKFGSWMKKYPKDKTIVLYCALSERFNKCQFDTRISEGRLAESLFFEGQYSEGRLGRLDQSQVSDST